MKWVHDWAKYRAVDYSGKVYEYELKPRLDSSIWVAAENSQYAVVGNDNPKYWKNSLEKRQEEPMNIEQRIEQAEKMIAECKELLAESKMPQKDWPDTFEEAREQSRYWGFEVDGDRYIIIISGYYGGVAARVFGIWTTKEDMQEWWSGDVETDFDYRFIKFNSAAELYRWMLEG